VAASQVELEKAVRGGECARGGVAAPARLKERDGAALAPRGVGADCLDEEDEVVYLRAAVGRSGRGAASRLRAPEKGGEACAQLFRGRLAREVVVGADVQGGAA
jgi:hypothetical protein